MNRDFAGVLPRPNIFAAGAVFLMAISGSAQAAGTGGFYVAGAVTGSLLDKPRQTIANAPAPGRTLQVVNTADFGWGGQAEIGYACRMLRIEAEIGHTQNHSNRYSAISPIAVTLPQSGKNTINRYMANAYLDLPLALSPVRPYIGAGIGAAHATVSAFAAPARAPLAPPSQLLGFSDTRFAYQAMAGLSLHIAPHLAMTVQYRWFDGGTFHGVDARGQPATRTLYGSNIDVGLRLGF